MDQQRFAHLVSAKSAGPELMHLCQIPIETTMLAFIFLELAAPATTISQSRL